MSKETIEEAAGKFSKLRKEALNEKKEWSPDCIYHESFNGFMCGAECQAERMYSEEEVLQIIDNYRHHFELYRNIQVLPDMFFEWFDKTRKQK
jgi:hypothetical protein